MATYQNHRSTWACAHGLLLLLCTFFVLQAGFSGLALAVPPKRFEFDRIELVTDQQNICLNLGISVDAVDGLRDLLKDGAVVELTVGLTLERVRSWWGNASLYVKTYTSSIRHDLLTREFILSVPDGEAHKEIRDRNLSRLLQRSWLQMYLVVAPLGVFAETEPGDRIQVIAAFSLQHKEVPPWLEQSNLFWSSDIVPSETITLEYTR